MFVSFCEWWMLFWMAMRYFKFLIRDLGHHVLFYLLYEYNMSYCISLSWIYTCSHTLGAPHGLQNLGGVSNLIYASDVFMIIIEIQIHCIY